MSQGYISVRTTNNKISFQITFLASLLLIDRIRRFDFVGPGDKCVGIVTL